MKSPNYKPLLMASLLSLPLQGQVFADPYLLPMGQWTQQGRLIRDTDAPLRWLKNGRMTEVTHPALPNPLPEVPGLPPSANIGELAFHLDGSLWINGWTKKDMILFRHTGTKWEEAAHIPCTLGGRTSNMLPLRNGRYLVFNPPDPEAKPGKVNPYFFGLFARNDRGDLEARSLESMAAKDWTKDSFLVGASRVKAAALTENHLTVCCPEYGRFWIFSLEDGRLQHTVDLYGQEVTKILGRKSIPRMVLEFQPRKDGRLLICARDESLIKPLVEAIQKAETRLDDLLQSKAPEGQEMAKVNSLERQMAEVLMPFPHLTWFEMNPETGSVKRLNPSPVGAKDILPVGTEAPFWLVDEDDRVVYTDPSFEAFPKGEESKKPLESKPAKTAKTPKS